jgi:hypothetical protein
MDLFDTCTWAHFIVETTFLGTPTIHFPLKDLTVGSTKIGSNFAISRLAFKRGCLEAILSKILFDNKNSI